MREGSIDAPTRHPLDWQSDTFWNKDALNEELERRGELEHVGGTPALLELTEAVPTSANAVYYAEIVRDHYTRRQLIQVAAEVQKDAPAKTPFVVCKRPEAVVFIDCDGHHGVAHSVSDVAMT